MISDRSVGETLVKAELDGRELIMLECEETGVRALITDPAGRRNADNSYELSLSKDGVLESMIGEAG